MLFLLLLSLFVQTNGVSMVLKPQRNLTKTENMVGELAGADPSKVEDLLGMLQSMMDGAQDAKEQLKLQLENTEKARNIAADKHAAAIQAHVNSQVALDAARIVKEEADEKYRVAEEATNYAQAAVDAAIAELQVVTQVYDDAVTFFNTENPRLEHEISVLQDMIALHGHLNNVVAVIVGPETLITPGGRDGWTGFSMINTNAVVPAHESNQAVRLVGWQWNGFDDSNTITLQIYRHTSGNNYKVIGQFTYDSQTGLNQMELADALAVESGDLMGWTFHGSAAVGFTGGSDSVLWGSNNVQFNTVGNTYNFPGRGGRNYPINAQFEIYNVDVVPFTVGPETLITPGGRDGWTGFSMINTNAVVPAHESNQCIRLVGWQWNGFDDSNTITLQIYRQTSGTNYKVIGQFTYDSQNGLNEVVLADALAVESGDFVGWTFHGSAAVGFTGGSDSVLWGSNNVQFNTVGNTYNFPGRGGRNYPIRANFEIYG